MRSDGRTVCLREHGCRKGRVLWSSLVAMPQNNSHCGEVEMENAISINSSYMICSDYLYNEQGSEGIYREANIYSTVYTMIVKIR